MEWHAAGAGMRHRLDACAFFRATARHVRRAGWKTRIVAATGSLRQDNMPIHIGACIAAGGSCPPGLFQRRLTHQVWVRAQ